MTFSVVIPAFNGWQYLNQYLPDVLALGADEVIVVDDASTDDTAELISSHFPQINLIRQSQNLRFPKTVNHGFSKSSGDIIILLNQDLKPDKNLIKAITRNFIDPLVFAVTFNEQQTSWAKVSFTNGWLEYVNGPKKTTIQPSFWASGGSAAFRKSYWDKLGGFDPVFTPGYHEDLDIGWRARKHGWKIVWVPDAKVNHIRETAYKQAFKPKYLQWIKDRNFLICQWKNLDCDNLFIHFIAVFSRCLKHPGFIIPVLMAKWHWPRIIWYRLKNRNLLPDSEIFKY